MKKNAARKISENDPDLNKNFDLPVQLFVRKEESPMLANESAYISKRFRGDLLIYFLAIGMWLAGTVWLVVKLIDKFF